MYRRGAVASPLCEIRPHGLVIAHVCAVKLYCVVPLVEIDHYPSPNLSSRSDTDHCKTGLYKRDLILLRPALHGYIASKYVSWCDLRF
jgi:hypothetical protein